jgi:hypothetical protein
MIQAVVARRGASSRRGRANVSSNVSYGHGHGLVTVTVRFPGTDTASASHNGFVESRMINEQFVPTLVQGQER